MCCSKQAQQPVHSHTLGSSLCLSLVLFIPYYLKCIPTRKGGAKVKYSGVESRLYAMSVNHHPAQSRAVYQDKELIATEGFICILSPSYQRDGIPAMTLVYYYPMFLQQGLYLDLDFTALTGHTVHNVTRCISQYKDIPATVTLTHSLTHSLPDSQCFSSAPGKLTELSAAGVCCHAAAVAAHDKEPCSKGDICPRQANVARCHFTLPERQLVLTQ